MTTETAQPDRYVKASDWSRILAALRLPASAVPADVIAALDSKTAGERAQAERDARATAIRECQHCDPFGWRLDTDGLPVEPAQKCDHNKQPTFDAPARSFDEPLRGRDEDEPR